ncbi:DUF6886 family protein [Chitinophaga sp. RAB17]|uniref:DUF6886 family protein n=1 Tax=Chitinophaga sp. RAB17 TaxID=3233049 RepID=UPI003F935D80
MEKLYHISEDPRIKIFEPRPASFYPKHVLRHAVFAISGQLLHNYLLPRNCPRVTFYAGPDTTEKDRIRFMGNSTATYVVAVESAWLRHIQQAIIYCYEFPPDTFSLFDQCAGYYVSLVPVTPVSVRPIYNVMAEMLQQNVELRFMPSLTGLADAVKYSTLNFSLIRMQYAKTGGT